MKPKILLSTSRDDPKAYVDMITRCGGDPITGYCPTYDDSYDALLLCGGCDMDPSYYGEEINGSVNIDPDRDRAEFSLIDAFLEAGKPIFGICRGLQVLNVYFGGTLHQHLSSSSRHSPMVYGCYLAHGAIASPGSVWEKLYGKQYTVNSHHHQGIKTLANDFGVTMTDDTQTVIEAISHKKLPVYAVQWHPERMCFDYAREDTVDGRFAAEYFISRLFQRKD